MDHVSSRYVLLGALACLPACSSAVGGVAMPPGNGAPPPVMLTPDPGYGTRSTPAPAPTPAVCSPETRFTGAPITDGDNTWSWVPFPDAHCRDGSPTGIGIRRKEGSTKLAIYFEGGGACFHDQSCTISLANFDQNAFNLWSTASGSGGIFDASRAENPLRDFNMVYVPYCTGDVHAGDVAHVDVPGNAPKDQWFVGYRNVQYYLDRLVPTFAHASQVVVTGISAGGFGAALNYDRIAQAFCHSNVQLLDDSGPPMSDEYLAPCLQQRWRDLWNLDAVLPADCPACRGADGGGIVNYVPYLAAKYPNARLGLISANQDGIISMFFGYGANNCAGLNGTSAGMSGATFEAGLDDLRNRYLKSVPNWGEYIVPSTSHTWTGALTFYTTKVNGTNLTDWVNQLVTNDKVSYVAP